ncbi:hypothetical protein TUM4644_36740 [Shewanella colwelliana]|uniref:DUF2987 domain-containing protein n=1 Tax=Shewanella colwelliana TaxID=23 RepID=UPI001BBCB748|nr:DUF2987 domain-containing protein [Shewanella colwelliana]GIU35529.1 hypothetical protein TUM4644_36740 [Shewanella colwelliana]
MNKGLLFSCLITASAVVQAAPISLEYQGFYQRLKQVNKGHYPLIEIAFSVPKANGCVVKSGSLTTEKESFPLTITDKQRIFLPFDDRLKSDRAVINLDMVGDASQCGIAMQIRAKQTKQQYQQAEIVDIQNQMNALLSAMQGFPMRYFSDEITGVNFEFEHPASVVIDGNAQPVEGVFRLSRHALEQITELSFSRAPDVVSPWTNGQ